MNPWTFWWELWMRTAMAPFEAMAAASRKPQPAGIPQPARDEAAPEAHKEEFLARRMRTELEAKGPQGIIDEGGRG